MAYTYHFVFDEPYYRTMIERYREQEPLSQGFWLFGVVALVALLAVLKFVDYNIAAMFALGLLAALSIWAGRRLGWMVIDRDFRYTPSFGKACTCVISDEGVRAFPAWGAEVINWLRLRSVVRHRDGIMLRRFVPWPDRLALQTRYVCWLPDSALEAVSPQLVTEFVSAQRAFRNVA